MIPVLSFFKTQATGIRDGLPTFPGVFLRSVDGRVKAFVDRHYPPWEGLEEAMDFPAEVLARIQAVHDDDLSILTQDRREVLSELRKEPIRRARAAAYAANADGLAYEALEKEKRGENASKEWDVWLKKKQQIRNDYPYPGEDR